VIDFCELNTLTCAGRSSYKNWLETLCKVFDDKGVPNCINCLDDNRMESLVFLERKLRKPFVPVFESDFMWLKVKVLNEIVARI